MNHRIVLIPFHDAKRPYWCRRCERWVTIAPCPACIARRAKAEGVKSAVPKSNGRRTRQQQYQALSVDETISFGSLPDASRYVPEEVQTWVHWSLERMIDDDGRHAEVAEAIDNFTAQLRSLVVSIAGVIGEERREAAVKMNRR